MLAYPRMTNSGQCSRLQKVTSFGSQPPPGPETMMEKRVAKEKKVQKCRCRVQCKKFYKLTPEKCRYNLQQRSDCHKQSDFLVPPFREYFKLHA